MHVTQSEPLLHTLSALLPSSSRSRHRQFIQQGRVLVDSKVCYAPNHTVFPGQVVTFSEQKIHYESNISILFQDEHLVVIEKPSGLLSVATNFETAETAHALLKNRYKNKKVYVIHRLDQETSGLMLFGLSNAAYLTLKENLKARKIKREYIALVAGKVPNSGDTSGTWRSYLYEDQNYHVFSTDDPQKGALAITHYEVLSYKNGVTTLRCRLETGKKHQIRVHAKDAGYPIIGDDRYNTKHADIKRLALHSYHLELQHPITKKRLVFTSKLPREFQKFTPSSI